MVDERKTDATGAPAPATFPAANPCIIGFTGSFGSGCTYVVDNIVVPKGIEKVSLSAILREVYAQDTGRDSQAAPRSELQAFGDGLRRRKAPDFLATQALLKIQETLARQPGAKFVVDSIRNPSEVRALRAYSRNSFLFGVYAEKDVRWKRVRAKYNDNWAAFDTDDKNDTGGESESHGQRVGDCFYEADVVLKNNDNFAAPQNADFQSLAGVVSKYVDLVTQSPSRKQPIRKEEALMAMAYAASQQSSCLKRKVGAVIVDGFGNVISSGFNEVPKYENPCEGEYLECYRDWSCKDFFGTLKGKIPEVKGREDDLRKVFRSKFKILDYCRALHAEENAILNLARNGSGGLLGDCTLYTTTYPCRQCANRIANVGIKRVVYVEPYPDEEAKVILRGADVVDVFFQGVTFKAYFRIYGEEK